MTIPEIVVYIGYFTALLGFGATLWKFWTLLKNIVLGQQCVLRSEITHTYYSHVDEESPALREYERKNLDDLFAGYKALGGNHFVDDIYNTMRKWHVDQ